MRYKTQELVSSFKSSGLSQKDYCLRHGIVASTLSYHLNKLKRAKETGGTFLPLHVKRSSTDSKTVVIFHGELSLPEVAEFVRELL